MPPHAQFARRPHHQVGLHTVLAEAELTKGAMYFHFRGGTTLITTSISPSDIASGPAEDPR